MGDMGDPFFKEFQRALATTENHDLPSTAASVAVSPCQNSRFCGFDSVLDLVRDAMDHKRGMLAYQPVFSARHRATPSFYEGLIRIFARDNTPIRAREFIYDVDRSVIGREIDCLSLELALRTLSEQPDLRLSINASARSLFYPRWNKMLDRWLSDDPYIGERLILEVSESSVTKLPELVVAFMRQRRADGIAFALDYFGSGSLGFREIREFGFDIVKIDREFVRNIAADTNNQTMLKALLFVAQSFDMLTVAVSVESEADAQYLTEIDVDCLQGSHLGKPTLKPTWLNKGTARQHGLTVR